MRLNKRVIENALREAAHPRASGEGIRLHRADGGCDHVTVNEYGHITTYAAGRNWSDQKPQELGDIHNNEHVEIVVRSLYARRSEIFSLNGSQFKD